jgi:hypothetical protein
MDTFESPDVFQLARRNSDCIRPLLCFESASQRGVGPRIILRKRGSKRLKAILIIGYVRSSPRDAFEGGCRPDAGAPQRSDYARAAIDQFLSRGWAQLAKSVRVGGGDRRTNHGAGLSVWMRTASMHRRSVIRRLGLGFELTEGTPTKSISVRAAVRADRQVPLRRGRRVAERY